MLIAAGAPFLIALVWRRSALPLRMSRRRYYTARGGTDLIDINTATAEELTALPGLGSRKAAALVAYREAHGLFATLADAAAVKGGISLAHDRKWAGRRR